MWQSCLLAAALCFMILNIVSLRATTTGVRFVQTKQVFPDGAARYDTVYDAYPAPVSRARAADIRIRLSFSSIFCKMVAHACVQSHVAPLAALQRMKLVADLELAGLSHGL